MSDDNKIELEVKCLRKECEVLRADQLEIVKGNVVLHIQNEQLVTDSKTMKIEVASLSKSNTEIHVKHDMLEKRHLQHSLRHDNNYKELQENLSSFKGDVLSRLDSMGGRDSVLKVVFGTIIGIFVALSLGFIKQKFGI